MQDDDRREGHLGPPSRLERININFTRLRYFVAVAQELHFGRAARRLGISQPPLTKHIQALEQLYGTALFERTRRSVNLTPAGAVLLAEAKNLLAHAERVSHVMQGAGAGALENLFLGCVPYALFGALPAYVRGFREVHPDTNIVLAEGHTASVLGGVGEGRFDFGVVWKNHGTIGLSEHPIVAGGFVAALPDGHRLLEKPAVALADLAEEPLILPSRQHSPYHHDQFIAAFVAIGVTPKIDYEIPTILSQLGFVASGLGIALVPHIARRMSNLGVGFRPIVDGDVQYKLLLVWNEERLTAPGRHFLDFARARSDLSHASLPQGQF